MYLRHVKDAPAFVYDMRDRLWTELELVQGGKQILGTCFLDQCPKDWAGEPLVHLTVCNAKSRR